MVTGGEAWNGTHRLAGSRVQVYGTAGAGKRLPDMNTPRMYHACGHYIKDDKVVNYIYRVIVSTDTKTFANILH